MTRSEFLPTVEVSAEDVLAIIRDRYRHAEQLDLEAEQGIDLTFESSVEEWRQSCDLLPFTELWPALNSWFGVTFPAFEWRTVLEPAETKKLGGVCTLIATRATRPTIRPFPVAGIECRSAGTFLVIRSLLASAGVPVQNIRPSTPLADYAREYADIFVAEVGKLAPGALPVPQVEHSLAYKASISSLCAGFAVVIPAFKWHVLFAAEIILLSVGFAGAWITSKFPPKAVTFGKLVTFADLAKAVLRTETADPTRQG